RTQAKPDQRSAPLELSSQGVNETSLTILVAADFVQRCGGDNEFFGVNRTAKPFFEFDGWNTVTFRLELMDFYEKHFPNIAAIVKGLPQ
ncbi:hypothetical protein, partial [Parvibaculum sedimenti]|uniref:hypothetical protein n=1 Tax=Parvibaculum sedimenti TaxID=2608632 RepID=UPI00163B5043